MAWHAWLAAGLALVILAGSSWWARGFLHHAWRQARGRKHAPQPLRAYTDALASEVKATLSVLVNRGATWFKAPPDNVHDPQGGPPIVLVPDPALGWATMARVARVFREQGFTNVHLVDSSRGEARVEDQGRLVVETLEQVTEEASSLAVGVAHGTGGLALRWAMGAREASLLAHAVFAGTPHAGTRQPSFRGMDRSQARAGATSVPGVEQVPLVPCTGVFSHVDDRVVPASSARWGDQAVAVPGVGHRGLVWEDRSTRVILAAVVASLADRGEP